VAAPLFDATSLQFVDLLAACPIVPGAIVSKPLLNLPEGKVVLFAMDAGQEISDHRAPFVSTVQVLDGRLRFTVE
jgi:quercetin dioxygenase-like cupin family protein